MGDPLILIVEDDDVHREIFLRYAEQCGLRVQSAGNGAQALMLIANRSHDYALILMDCRMPGMDGLECTRRIREWEHGTGKRVSIIAITGEPYIGAVDACFQAGMDDFVTKPVTLDQFRVMVNLWLGNRVRSG